MTAPAESIMPSLDSATPNAGQPDAVAPAALPGQSVAPEYGAEVPPKGPRQDMYAVDELAGGPVDDRRGDPAAFTGGDKEQGLGGQAIGVEPGIPAGDAVLGERIGI